MNHLGCGKPLQYLFPAIGGAVVRFVDDDHVKEIIGKLHQPFLDGRGELLDIGDDDVAFCRDRNVAAVKRAGQGPGCHLYIA